MADVSKTTIRRLYVVSASIQSPGSLEVCPGILLASNEAEAVGLHVEWMRSRMRPGSLMGPIEARAIPIELIKEAINAQP